MWMFDLTKGMHYTMPQPASSQTHGSNSFSVLPLPPNSIYSSQSPVSHATMQSFCTSVGSIPQQMVSVYSPQPSIITPLQNRPGSNHVLYTSDRTVQQEQHQNNSSLSSNYTTQPSSMSLSYSTQSQTVNVATNYSINTTSLEPGKMPVFPSPIVNKTIPCPVYSLDQRFQQPLLHSDTVQPVSQHHQVSNSQSSLEQIIESVTDIKTTVALDPVPLVKPRKKRGPGKKKLQEEAAATLTAKNEASGKHSETVDAKPITMKRSGREYAEGTSLHVCLECSKAFTHPRHLEAHRKVHQVKKNYLCIQCDRLFTVKGNLDRHIRSHLGKKPFPCTHCDKEFTQSSHLKNHIRRHTGERPFKCDICSKTFSVKGNMERHQRTHTGEKPYVCPRCFMVFSQSTHLESHIRTHNGEKPHRCPRCFQTFSSKGNLDRHLKIHFLSKSYFCSSCLSTFSRYPELQKHQLSGPCACPSGLSETLASVASLPQPSTKNKEHSSLDPPAQPSSTQQSTAIE